MNYIFLQQSELMVPMLERLRACLNCTIYKTAKYKSLFNTTDTNLKVFFQTTCCNRVYYE